MKIYLKITNNSLLLQNKNKTYLTEYYDVDLAILVQITQF